MRKLDRNQVQCILDITMIALIEVLVIALGIQEDWADDSNRSQDTAECWLSKEGLDVLEIKSDKSETLRVGMLCTQGRSGADNQINMVEKVHRWPFD